VLKLEPSKKGNNAIHLNKYIAILGWHSGQDVIQVPLIMLSSVKPSLTAFTGLLVPDCSMVDMRRPCIPKSEKEPLIFQK
jgi:hypothetical protein